MSGLETWIIKLFFGALIAFLWLGNIYIALSMWRLWNES